MCIALTIKDIEDRACRIEILPLSDWSEQALWCAFWRGEFYREEIFWASRLALSILDDTANFVQIEGKRVPVDSSPALGNDIPNCEQLATGDDDRRLSFWSLLGSGIGLPEISPTNSEANIRRNGDLLLSLLPPASRELARCLMITPVGLIQWCRETGKNIPEFIQSIDPNSVEGHESSLPGKNIEKWAALKHRTQIRYFRWHNNVPSAKSSWKRSNKGMPSRLELATEIAKLEKAESHGDAAAGTIRRRLDEYFPGWAD